MPRIRSRVRIKFAVIALLTALLVLIALASLHRGFSDTDLDGHTSQQTPQITSSRHPSSHPSLDSDALVKDWHNYSLIALEAARTGPGEQGSGVRIESPQDKAEQQRIYRANGYDGFASDKIAIDRSLRDLRHPECRTKKYLRQLPTVSLIIPFHQEHWSPLLRTVDSALRRSPAGLIREVILVDDASRKPFLGKQLEQHLAQYYPLTRVVRAGERQGLIRTRLLGARAARYDVLIFLDSHCEASTNWLPPLLEPIAKDYRTVTCPFIDVLDMDTFEYRIQDEGARGSFDWQLHYKRLPRLRADQTRLSAPFASPVMAGGLFAISREWFWQLGGYDPGLDIWGGEQFELSFKLWQCGGRMLDIPCSRIGHVYRKFAPFPNNAHGNFVLRNFKRVARVWMDEYQEYLYQRSPALRHEDSLNISAQLQIRERLHCRNFSWFMHEVAFDQPLHFPLVEPAPAASGELTLNPQLPAPNSSSAAFCVDFKFGSSGSPVYLSPCLSVNPAKGGQQTLELSFRGDVHAPNIDVCLDSSDHHPGGALLLFTCHGGHGNQFFKFNPNTSQMLVVTANLCLEGHPASGSITVQQCNSTSANQRWGWTKTNQTELLRLFSASGHEAEI